MKKIILILALLVFAIPAFAGCDNLGETYWIDTMTNLETIFGENEEGAPNCEDFVNAYNIQYSENLNTIIASPNAASYKELNEVYAPLFKSAISYAKDYYVDFLINPKNPSNQFKDLIKSINSNVASFKASVARFASAKADYEMWIQREMEELSVSEAIEDDQLNARLILFKREYISIIKGAYNLSRNVFDARRVGYYDFADYSNENLTLADPKADVMLAVTASNLEIVDCAIKITTKYNANNMASDYAEYLNLANGFYINIVEGFKADEITLVEDVKSKLNVWKGAFDMFVGEKAQFNNVLNILDLKLLSKNGNDAVKFAEETNSQQNLVYANYYLNFHEYISVLQKYAEQLFVK